MVSTGGFRPSLISYDRAYTYQHSSVFSLRPPEELYARLSGITIPQITRNIVYLAYGFGAATMDLLFSLRQKDLSLEKKLREKAETRREVEKLVNAGYLTHWECVRERAVTGVEKETDIDVISERVYDYYSVSEYVAGRLAKKQGVDFYPYLSDPIFVPCLLSAAQGASVLLNSFSGVPDKNILRHGILNFSQMPYFKVYYKGYWHLYVISLRTGLDNNTAQLADAVELLKNHLQDRRVIAVCDDTALMIDIADRLLHQLNQSELYGIYFMDDLSYRMGRACFLQVYRNAGGLEFKPVRFF